MKTVLLSFKQATGKIIVKAFVKTFGFLKGFA